MNQKSLKPIIFIITFLILIAITPFIFSKIMNSKFNSMLDEYRAKGFKIQEINNTSSYLTTNRTFIVTIPNKELNSTILKDIESATLKIKTTFKNLPVTNVIFNVEILDLEGIDPSLNKFIQKNIKAHIVTNNFKEFIYKFDDINYKELNDKLTIEGMNGIYSRLENKNLFNMKKFYLLTDDNSIELNNFKSNFKYQNSEIYSNLKSNLHLKLNNTTIQVTNLNYEFSNSINKYLNGKIDLNFDKLVVMNLLELSDLKYEMQANNIYIGKKENISKLINYNHNNLNKIQLEALHKGFDIKYWLSLNDIKLLSESKDFKSAKSKLFINVKENNITNENDLIKYINIKAYLEITPEFATFLMSNIPQSIIIFSFAKKINNKIILDAEIRDGKLFTNGREIK